MLPVRPRRSNGSFTRAAAEATGLRKSTVSRNVSRAGGSTGRASPSAHDEEAQPRQRRGPDLLRRTTARESRAKSTTRARGVDSPGEVPAGSFASRRPRARRFLEPHRRRLPAREPGRTARALLARAKLRSWRRLRPRHPRRRSRGLDARRTESRDSRLGSRRNSGLLEETRAAALAGRPAAPVIVAFGAGTGTISMHFARDGESVHVALTPRMRHVNDVDVVLRCAQASAWRSSRVPLRGGSARARLTRARSPRLDAAVDSSAVIIAEQASPRAEVKHRFADHLQAQMPPPPWRWRPRVSTAFVSRFGDRRFTSCDKVGGSPEPSGDRYRIVDEAPRRGLSPTR